MRFRITPILQGLASLIIAFSLIREAFGNGISQRAVDAHTQPTPVTEIIAQAEEFFLHIGGKMGLIPTERALSGADHRIDASLAVAGFLFLVVAVAINTVQKLRGK